MEKRENTSKKDKVAKNAFYCLYPEAITACKLYSSKRGCMRKTECAICFWLGHKIITLNIIFHNFENPRRTFSLFLCQESTYAGSVIDYFPRKQAKQSEAMLMSRYYQETK